MSDLGSLRIWGEPDDELRQAFRYGKELGIRFESLSYEKNSTGLRL